MRRTLRLSRTALLMLAIVSITPMASVATYVWVADGCHLRDLNDFSAVLPGLIAYLIFISILAATRVTVTEDRVIITTLMMFQRSALFSDIKHTVRLRPSSNEDYTTRLCIRKTDTHARPLAFRIAGCEPEDLRWFLSLPQLKLRMRTKRT
jgi:hypothetical protein